MHFIIIGSGRVGRLLCEKLLKKNHTVSIVSNDQLLLDLIPDQNRLCKIKGVPFDRDVLKRANIDNAVGLASVTDDDNLNILVTRMAKMEFGVKKVVVRVYDQSKAEVFAKLGIPTVSTIHWTVDNALRELVPIGADSQFIDLTGNIVLSQVDFDNSWCGVSFGRIEKIIKSHVAYVERFGNAILVEHEDILQDGDKLHVLAKVDHKDNISKILLKPVEINKDKEE